MTRISRSLPLFVIAALCVSGCSRSASKQDAPISRQEARQQARAAAQGRENDRQQLEKIPPPTKSQYVDVRTPDTWQNPFLSVGVDSIKLRVVMPDANPSQMGQGGMLRPVGARRQDLDIRIANLPTALTSLPIKAWPYGRVIAVAEGPTTDKKLRLQIRRNVETTIQTLNDLGIVVDEWPTKEQ